MNKNYFIQTVPNEQLVNPYGYTTTSTISTVNVNFENDFYSQDVTVHCEDIDMDTINITKEESMIGIQILANGLVENDIKVYTMDGKLVVEFLEEEVDYYENEILLEGFEQPCGKVEFQFSNLYDYGSPKIDLMLGILFISVSKFEEYLKKDIQIGNPLF
jgi:HSP20 family molecular chaperone IbpA